MEGIAGEVKQLARHLTSLGDLEVGQQQVGDTHRGRFTRCLTGGDGACDVVDERRGVDATVEGSVDGTLEERLPSDEVLACELPAARLDEWDTEQDDRRLPALVVLPPVHEDLPHGGADVDTPIRAPVAVAGLPEGVRPERLENADIACKSGIGADRGPLFAHFVRALHVADKKCFVGVEELRDRFREAGEDVIREDRVGDRKQVSDEEELDGVVPSRLWQRLLGGLVPSTSAGRLDWRCGNVLAKVLFAQRKVEGVILQDIDQDISRSRSEFHQTLVVIGICHHVNLDAVQLGF